MKLIDSALECRTCGEQMSCLLTGPEQMPNIHATYLCPNMDWRGVCQGAQTPASEGGR